MARFSYVDLISAIENEDTIKIIGKIDVRILNEPIVENLYYAFPLIERMILEIYKQIPDADVEHYEQGIMKTPISIINNNSSIEVLPENAINIIVKYYDGDCLRNKIMHVKNETINIMVSIDELNYLIMQLLSILKRLLKENDKMQFEDIEYL